MHQLKVTISTIITTHTAHNPSMNKSYEKTNDQILVQNTYDKEQSTKTIK